MKLVKENFNDGNCFIEFSKIEPKIFSINVSLRWRYKVISINGLAPFCIKSFYSLLSPNNNTLKSTIQYINVYIKS